MIVEATPLSGVLVVKPTVHRDARGHLVETWRAREYGAHGIGPFAQDNVSVSARGVLRGLHFQCPHSQGKLVSAIRGRILDVAVDVRAGSPTFGRWLGMELSDENGWQLWLPEGFAHGFVTQSAEAVVMYKCTSPYAPDAERTIRWNDAAIGIDWAIAGPTVSPRDAAAPLLSELPADALPRYVARA